MRSLQHWRHSVGGNLIGRKGGISASRTLRSYGSAGTLHRRLRDRAVDVVGASEEEDSEQDRKQKRQYNRGLRDLCSRRTRKNSSYR